ncbi:MAG: DUF3467 domain-containing protein [Chloroflexota bacterium]
MANVRQITVHLPEDIKPIYANMVRIAHTPAEFVLDFSAILPGNLKPEVLARVVMSAMGLKLLHRALGENIARYESSFGEIQLPASHTLADDLFHNTANPQDPEE